MITKTINGCVSDPIFIGRKGENEATQIYFDVPSDLSEYSYTVYMRRPKERESYVCAYAVKDGDYIVWTVSNVDTAITGNGEVQIRYTSDDVVVKTMVYPVQIGRAIDVETTDAPEWYDTWLDALTALSETTTENAEAAAESATNAATSETNAGNSASAAATSETNAAASESAAAGSAEDAAESAADALYYANLAAQSAESAGYIYVEVDPDTMQLQVTTTTDLQNDLTLSVNADTGILEVIIS